MNRSIKIVVVLSSLAAFWCCAESFVLQEKPVRRATPGQLKQEIVQEMAALLEQATVLIQTKAQIQQNLCAQIRGYADSDKASFLSRASMNDLKRVLKLLHEEKGKLDKEQHESSRLLAALKAL